MPLVIGKEVLDKARREGYAVPSFNTNNLEITQAILEVAEELRLRSSSRFPTGPGSTPGWRTWPTW